MDLKKHHIHYRLRGSAVTYAIFIMVVVLIIIASVLIISRINSNIISNSGIHFQLKSNINSGINLLLADYNICRRGESKTVKPFEDSNDSIFIERQSWGIFDLCKVSAKKKHLKLKKVFFSGGYTSQMGSTALYLADQNRPLSICGNSQIKGNCYLPESGVKKTFIDGLGYQGSDPVAGTVYYSEPEIPALKDDLASIKYGTIISKYLFAEEAIVYFWDEITGDSLVNSFCNNTVIVYSPKEIRLTDVNIKSNIIIISEKRIIVDSGCMMNDIILCAPSIYLGNGFKSSIQCIAEDSLIVGKNCSLQYPSALVLSNPKSNNMNNKGAMYLKTNCLLEGVMICNTSHDRRVKKPVLTIDQGSIILGQLWCNSLFQMKGTMIGVGYVQSFYLKTPTSIYENHLLNAVFNKTSLPEYFTGPQLFRDDEIKRVVKWVN